MEMRQNFKGFRMKGNNMIDLVADGLIRSVFGTIAKIVDLLTQDAIRLVAGKLYGGLNLANY